MLNKQEQENLIRQLANTKQDVLAEIIRKIWSIDFPTVERLHFITVLSFLSVNKAEDGLKIYWQLDENERLNFIELIR